MTVEGNTTGNATRTKQPIVLHVSSEFYSGQVLHVFYIKYYWPFYRSYGGWIVEISLLVDWEVDSEVDSVNLDRLEVVSKDNT